MKKLVIFVTLVMTSIASFAHQKVSDEATVVGDTIFYSAAAKNVATASEASYYRLLMTQGTGRAKEDVFKDYYMDGTLRAEGGYTFIDLGNDNNTVFNGDITTYYANGKEKMRGKYVNGKRNGYFTLQMRNGGVAVVQYDNGTPRQDYYIVTMPDGSQTKRPLSEIKTLLQ